MGQYIKAILPVRCPADKPQSYCRPDPQHQEQRLNDLLTYETELKAKTWSTFWTLARRALFD
jgi:hypothetical protein